MRQFGRWNAGWRHRCDEGARGAVLERDGRLVAVERSIHDVGDSAGCVGHGEGACRAGHVHNLILLTLQRQGSARDSVTLARDILSLDQEGFSAAFLTSPMKRAKLRGHNRSASAVLPILGTSADTDVLTRAIEGLAAVRRIGVRIAPSRRRRILHLGPRCSCKTLVCRQATIEPSMNLPITAPADPRRLAAVSDMDIDYGIDAPGVRRGMFTAAGVGVAMAIVGAMLIRRNTGPAAVAAEIACGLGLLATLYGAGMGAYMTFSSRVAKRRTRERLLDLAQTVVPWTGDEQVLDVGCGRGLMMIGAARRLSTGISVGVDLWRAEDQDRNTPDATAENARRAGVAERVRVETGDARALPFADGTFDVVLSHWVVHNLPDAGDRACVLDEMLRVLRRGGVLVLADIANLDEYRSHFVAHGAVITHVLDGGWEARILAALSGGSYRPQALVARRT